MGFYINPPDMTKEDWLIKHNVKIFTTPPSFESIREKNLILICLVDNGLFTTAGICYSQREIDAFNQPKDLRLKLWCCVPQEEVFKLMPEVIELFLKEEKMADRQELRENIVNDLSALILQYLGMAAHQQYNPSSDPDRMDAEIADAQKKAEGLRKIRNDFETLITGVIPY